jgi:hypothetical protein
MELHHRHKLTLKVKQTGTVGVLRRVTEQSVDELIWVFYVRLWLLSRKVGHTLG